MKSKFLNSFYKKKILKKNIYRRIGKLIIFISIIVLLLLPNQFNVNQVNSNLNNENQDDQLQLSSDQPNAKPLLVTQYATAFNTVYPLTLPKNVSFTLVEGWTSKNITIIYDGVSHYKNHVINSKFDVDETPWVYKFSNTEIQNEGWNDGHVRIKIKKDKNLIKGDYGYFEENISLKEPLNSEKFVTFSMDYYFNPDGLPSNNISFYLGVEINGIEKNKTIRLTDLVENTWTSMRMTYDPKIAGHQLPGNISLRVGVVLKNDTRTPNKDQKIWIDNVELNLWTSINQANLIKAYDNEFDSSYSYENITFGKGKTFIELERNRNETSDVVFTISKNETYTEDFEIYNITIFSSNLKVFNSTFSELEGTRYIEESEIKWHTECSVSIPFNYLENKVEIQKPNDWIITKVLDGYDINQIENCLGKGLGSEKLIIPKGVLNSGLWKIEANSQNYINFGSIKVWNGTEYIEESDITIGDNFQITVVLNDTILLANSQLNCTINYPNGTIFWSEIKEPILPEVIFGNFIVGTNMSVGEYQVKIEWTNSPSYLERDKVGFRQFTFSVWHHSTLTAVNSYIESISGDPQLIRVNFSDVDLNTYIDFAVITYNSTYGEAGTMSYIGSGIYIIDLDTSSLGLGDYYFSFFASKSYYENQSINDLIHLKIIAQSLALEVPYEVINTMVNGHVTCQINVTGAISGVLLWPVNITTNWHKNYTVEDHYNGTYSLNFSTYQIMSNGIPEIFSITIFASKTNYGSTSDVINLRVNPIQSVVNVNKTSVKVPINSHFYLKVNYTIEGTGELISGANCSLTWPTFYNINSINGEFVIFFDTTGLLLDVYTVKIELEHAGYETSFKIITVTLDLIEINVTKRFKGSIFQDSIDVNRGEDITIQIQLQEMESNINIEGANFTINWGYGAVNLTEKDNGIYELSLSIPGNLRGNYTIEIYILKEDSYYKAKQISFFISINDEQDGGINLFLILIIIISLISLSGLLLALYMRSQIFIPRKRKKELELKKRVQIFKDIWNIQALIIVSRKSGMPLYSKDISIFKKQDDHLISGFIQAITIFSEKIIENESSITLERNEVNNFFENMIELDFKHFILLICDFKSLRGILVTEKKCSERLKNQFYLLAVEINNEYSKVLDNVILPSEDLKSRMELLINQYLFLHYNQPFKLTENEIHLIKVLKSGSLTALETRIVNVILSEIQTKNEFYLMNVVDLIHEENKDLVLDGIRTLLELEIILPPTFTSKKK